MAGWRSELAGCRSTLSMSKIKVRISETKYLSFYKSLTTVRQSKLQASLFRRALKHLNSCFRTWHLASLLCTSLEKNWLIFFTCSNASGCPRVSVDIACYEEMSWIQEWIKRTNLSFLFLNYKKSKKKLELQPRN